MGCGLWSCRNVCDALSFLLGGFVLGFGTELCGQIVGIPMGTRCASLVAGLFLFCCGGFRLSAINAKVDFLTIQLKR